MNLFKPTVAALLAFCAASCCGQKNIRQDAEECNVRISWDYNTYEEMKSVNVSNKDYEETELHYPRIKKLSDGSLLMSFMNSHYGWDVFVRRSEDNGRTWSDATMLRQRYPAQSTAGDDEMVYVNPDFIELQDGRILLAYQWRYKNGYNDIPNTNGNCGIEIMFSSDSGRTFSQPRMMYTGRCWEPAMLQLPSGEIQMYITDSNETIDGLSQPCTMVIRSFDGGATWQGKDVCSYLDGEIISRTFDERASYDGMPSGVLLDDNYGIAVPLEVWSSKHKMDETPVIVRTDATTNWRSDQTMRREGGPEYPWKKQLNKDFVGFGPYSTKLPSGEMIVLSNGVYKGTQGIWVFVGDKRADNFRYPTSPFVGHWGSVDYAGDNRIVGTGSFSYADPETGRPRGGVRVMTARLNYAKEVAKGDVTMVSPAQFDRENSDWWFLGKETPASVFTDFGYTDRHFIFATYLFDQNLVAFTPGNSDASALLLNRSDGKGNSTNYKFVVNADGKYLVYREETNSWRLLDKGTATHIETVGTVNKADDTDTGFAAKLCVDWDLIGGKPRASEVLRAHMRHHYKPEVKEGPVYAVIEEMAGENSDYPCEWLRLTLK